MHSSTPTKSNSANRYQRIWDIVAQIPYGKVSSYGQIAELAGQARAARFVSRALTAAPENLQLPWHRVISANGQIAFKKNASAYKKQRDLLRGEGIVVNAGKVHMQTFRWQPSMDERLWRL